MFALSHQTFFSEHGRLGRLPFILCFLLVVLVTLTGGVLSAITALTATDLAITLIGVAALFGFVVLGSTAVTAVISKRMHDIGHGDGEIIITAMVMLAGTILGLHGPYPLDVFGGLGVVALFLYLTFKPGEARENAFGPVPR